MLRQLAPEILDELPADDPRAIHSRRDLQNINSLMGNVGTVTAALRGANARPNLLVELGAGDGSFLLRVATRLGRRDRPARAVLVDRRPSVSPDIRARFEALGWTIETEASDVLDWFRHNNEMADVLVSNLFLHHFSDDQLRSLLELASRQTCHVIACEPRRSRSALAAASLLGLTGCNDVTRHDAKVSVRAGFRDRELSRLWPGESTWKLIEGRAGPFTHLFVASKPRECRSSG